MKIVVIGGSGLIGSKLVEKLRAAGHDPLPASPDSGVDTLSGEGLQEALEGAQVVVDVSNAPAWDDAAVMDFFQTSSRNILAAETAAGVNHHVTLSVVGTDRLQGSGYFRAKLAQEEAVTAASVPYTILRATQFFEFIGRIADSSTEGDTVHLPPALIQPESADDVAATLVDLALSAPVNGIVELAGPETFPFDELVATRPERQERPSPGDRRRQRPLLRRAARRALPHPRRQPTHRPNQARGLAEPVHGGAEPRDQEAGLMKPTVVLVHGAFAESASWDGVIEPLLEAGHPVIAAANPLRDLATDAAGVADLVRTIDGPVLLVAHSYGGAVTSNVPAEPARSPDWST